MAGFVRFIIFIPHQDKRLSKKPFKKDPRYGKVSGIFIVCPKKWLILGAPKQYGKHTIQSITVQQSESFSGRYIHKNSSQPSGTPGERGC